MWNFRKKWIKKIKKINVSRYDFVQIVPQVNYLNIWKDFKNIPTEKECRKKTYWICEKDCEITILFSKGLELTYKIKAGYVTDFASIPSFARGVINENDSKIIVAAIIHDINFGTKYNTFSFSNTLFRMMMKYYGMGIIKRNIAYNAVKYFAHGFFGGTHQEIKERKKFVKLSDNFSNVK